MEKQTPEETLQSLCNTANASIIATAPRMADTLNLLVQHGFCPVCGCDKWNTAGCPICPVMRMAHECLADAGIVERRMFANYEEPDDTNKRNAGTSGLLLAALQQIRQKADSAMREDGGRYAYQALDSIDEIAEKAISNAKGA